MKRIVTAFALVLLALPVSVQAQTVVDLKQAFDVPQDSLDKAAANIGTLAPADLSRLLRSPFAGQSIQFTAFSRAALAPTTERHRAAFTSTCATRQPSRTVRSALDIPLRWSTATTPRAD